MSLKNQFFLITVGQVALLSLLVCFLFLFLKTTVTDSVHNTLAQSEASSKLADNVADVKLVVLNQLGAWKDLLLAGSDSKRRNEVDEKFHRFENGILQRIKELQAAATDPSVRETFSQIQKIEEQIGLQAEQDLANVGHANFNILKSADVIADSTTELLGKLNKLSDKITDDLEKGELTLAQHLKKIFVSSLIAVLIMALLAILSSRLAIGKMVSKIADFTGLLLQESEALKTGATVLSTSSSELTQTSTAQNAAILQTGAAVDELHSSSESASHKATAVQIQAEDNQNRVAVGRSTVSQLQQALKEMQASFKTTLDSFAQNKEDLQILRQLFESLETKTRMINEIVFQTKLLSFNASVEAARAGEMGKGFSVVAEEIGNLARMSGVTAEEISQMLGENKIKISAIIEAGQTRSQTVQQTTEQILGKIESAMTQSLEAFNHISESSDLSNTAMGEITNIAAEQLRALTEIRQALQNLEKSSEVLNQVSEKTSLNSEEISETSIRIANKVHSFNQIMLGSNQTSASS